MNGANITIIGGGQAGTQLALGLQRDGWDVRLVQDRTPDEIRAGNVLSGQVMFEPALEVERRFGLAAFQDRSPPIHDIHVTVSGETFDERALDWTGRLSSPARTTDQRLKISGWGEEFVARGGRLEIRRVGIPDLEDYARSSGLVIVAAGKGPISQIFDRDDERSVFTMPQRALALTYVRGMEPGLGSVAAYAVVPGIGEYIISSAMTVDGPCEIITFEGVPGGPMDSWHEVGSAGDHFRHSLTLLRQFVPWEAERFKHAELTDEHGIMTGRFTPVVRKPVGELPSGRLVLGMADAVVLNDPIAGQGANNAAICAGIYYDCITERGDRPFDRDWMQGTFDKYWNEAKASTKWSNMLLQPPEPAVTKLLRDAQHDPRVASRFVNSFAYPKDLIEALNPVGSGVRA